MDTQDIADRLFVVMIESLYGKPFDQVSNREKWLARLRIAEAIDDDIDAQREKLAELK
jgi:hypothetical protein